MAACNTLQRLSELNSDIAKDFIGKLLYQIYEHFDEQDLIDVTFKCTSNPTVLVTAHRLILSAASSYFRDLFKSDKGICPLIEITNIDGETFENLIIFCYTGKTLITLDNVNKMLKAALILKLEDAVVKCVDFIIENVNVLTLQHVYALERETQCEILKQKVFEYETENFMSVIQNAEFVKFEAQKLQKILECNTLNVPREEDLFQAVKRWYEHNTVRRKQLLPDLIACLRLTQLDKSFLLTEVQPLPGCELIAYKALSWISHPELRSKVALKYIDQRWTQSILAEQHLFAFRMANKIILQYDKTEDLWHKWGDDIKLDVTNFEVILMGENLIFIGGKRNNTAINEVISWSGRTKTVKRLPSLNWARLGHSVCVLNNKVYAIGGWLPKQTTNGGYLKSVEVYDADRGWKQVHNTIRSRAYAAAVAFNNQIYLIGGFNGKVLNSVERYDSTTDSWSRCAPMNDARESSVATVHKGKIFVVSGSNTPSVERYDPQKNEWTKICSLTASIDKVGCISIGNQLWAVGGYDSERTSIYSEENDIWIRRNCISLPGRYYCFTAPKTLFRNEFENFINLI